MIAILLATAVGHTSPVCTKLAADFTKNENDMVVIHRMNQQMIDLAYHSWLLYKDNNEADADRALNERARETDGQSEDDQKYLNQGNAITTLLIANHCTPPDHITGQSHP